MSTLENLLMLLGRLAVCSFFLWTALEKIKNWHRAGDFLKHKHVPYANYVLPVCVALQVVGGLSLLLGFYTRLGAIFLLIYMVAHAYKIHDFWNSQGEEKTTQLQFFLKDLAVIGGLLFILAMGGGHIAVHA
ncbi:MAG: DoxX family protein [Verrucomicrobia bacterium]|nr:DoxX family protein [Verrucomicrobiota bacterium]